MKELTTIEKIELELLIIQRIDFHKQLIEMDKELGQYEEKHINRLYEIAKKLELRL